VDILGLERAIAAEAAVGRVGDDAEQDGLDATALGGMPPIRLAP